MSHDRLGELFKEASGLTEEDQQEFLSRVRDEDDGLEDKPCLISYPSSARSLNVCSHPESVRSKT